jgi:hypothetical protein
MRWRRRPEPWIRCAAFTIASTITISPSQRLVKTGGPWSGFSGSHLAHRLVEHEAFTLCTGTKILADDEAGGAGLRARCGHAAIIRQVYARARERRVSFSIFTEQLLSSTPGDVENRAAVKAVRNEDLKLVGLAVRAGRKLIDKIFKGGALHR